MQATDSNVVYGMHSGLALLMDVHRPQRSNGYAIVYVNGSGWHAPLSHGAEALKDTPLGLPWIRAMRDGGYTVFAINHRAAPRFRHPCAVEDVQRAVRHVRHHAARYGVRADRIGGCGGSSGGHLISMLATRASAGDPQAADPVERHDASLHCVVARAAPQDLARLARGEAAGIVASYIGMLGRGEANGDYAMEHLAYRDASPLHHVSPQAPPFLMIHGRADTLVPLEQSTRMLAALQAAGVTCELMDIEGAGHGPDFPGALGQPDYLGATVGWFDRHLIGA